MVQFLKSWRKVQTSGTCLFLSNVNMCRQLHSARYRKFYESPFEYLIDHHRHEELRLLLDSPMEMYSELVDSLDDKRKALHGYNYPPDYIATDIPSAIFKYACHNGCVKCLKLFLDRSEEKKIDVNYKANNELPIHAYEYFHVYSHCLPLADCNFNDYPHRSNETVGRDNILVLLLSSAEEKGIDINGTDDDGKTLKDIVEESLSCSWSKPYPQYVYDVLGIDPSKIQKKKY